jgi:hypothetical protein|tara:strand:+ start:490 stop:777 length:288 start_codon:yes stop_codon:yes gene_type:complete
LASFTAKAAALIEATVFAAAKSCRLVFCWSFSLSSMLKNDDVVEEEATTALHIIIIKRTKRKQNVIVVVFKVVIISRKMCRRIDRVETRDTNKKQ